MLIFAKTSSASASNYMYMSIPFKSYTIANDENDNKTIFISLVRN